ncbi:hypothetical protein [Nonomuraea jabiensis]|uniref:hypothetical protein n=1 Tax=Nonomuraea jabiensis TaxID=882448 RepID=UPI003D754467
MRLRTSVAAVALAGAVTAGFAAGPASAATTARSAAAPWCLGHRLNDKGAVDKLWVWNGCKSNQSYKVRLANVPDLACRQLKPGGADYFTWGWPGRFDGLVTC